MVLKYEVNDFLAYMYKNDSNENISHKIHFRVNSIPVLFILSCDVYIKSQFMETKIWYILSGIDYRL